MASSDSAAESDDHRLEPAREAVARFLAEVDEVYRAEHPAGRGGGDLARPPADYEQGRALLTLPPDEQAAVVVAVFTFWLALRDDPRWHRWYALRWLLSVLARRRLPYTAGFITSLAAGVERFFQLGHVHETLGLVGIFELYARTRSLPETALAPLRHLRAAMAETYLNKEMLRAVTRLDELIGGTDESPIAPGEPWSDAARAELDSLPADRRAAWAKLLAHCGLATGSKPSAQWQSAAESLLETLTPEAFRTPVAAWFRLAGRKTNAEVALDVLKARLVNESLLKGLAWIAGRLDDRELARALGALALGAYRKVPGRGAWAPSLGNAAIAALGTMPGREGLGQLAVLRARIKNATAQRGVAKALDATAARLGLRPEEIDELGVPDYGMAEAGRLSAQLGEFTAELTAHEDGSTELTWRTPDGKRRKSAPATAKRVHAEAIKELKATAKDIETMIAAQRNRIDGLFLARRSWPYDAWRARYLDHPLVGLLARRLIWRFTTAERTDAGIFHDGRIVMHDDRLVACLGPEAAVELWHPIGHDTGEIQAWRTWLERHQVRQPFKQAHREVYLLTDAERQTGVYSNRFAAHILRQHQFNALCGVRGWKNTLRMTVNDQYPPATLDLPQWGLRGEFWIEGADDADGRDTHEVSAYPYLSTDQVRFYAAGSTQRYAPAGGGGYRRAGGGGGGDDEPVPLDRVPPLVFSEVMRDVDLFVGVASVGNDPRWSDGGPDGQYVDYWQRYSFGNLSATAGTRKEVLQRLVPRLKIADRCALSDRFLVVRGTLRTYKIHLGSGNILMEPDDRYLCIVPDRRPGQVGEKVFLPFEGDGTLSMILSKAFLLAGDAKITDPTIVSQINAL